jgi:hypothetical protein
VRAAALAELEHLGKETTVQTELLTLDQVEAVAQVLQHLVFPPVLALTFSEILMQLEVLDDLEQVAL